MMQGIRLESHTSTNVMKRYAAVRLWAANLGTPSNTSVWKFPASMLKTRIKVSKYVSGI